ncbi:hypothetical protein GE061_018176 [Apolygus lucorum]|uniref:Uncharacterized protein n=1 Tax=Apolygus lucorum TaxID=248454 RepID=A0A6A4J8E1_APOLU|nr:hypothetical protein GE061_018176 [Apolygus lucorum]
MSAVQQRETPAEIDDVLVLNGDDGCSRKKHKKKNKEERRKRSRSCSTDASSCSTSSKRKRKKKKHHRRSLDEPPSPKVNPIFLWVKEDNAKIVEVRCEDYDRRNRIKLTKTAGGWRAIPHVEIQWQTPGPLKASKTETTSKFGADLTCDVKIEPVRGETPPPTLEMCKTESDVCLSEVESREMPPLEPQTNVSPRRSRNKFVVLDDQIQTSPEAVVESDDQKESSDDVQRPALCSNDVQLVTSGVERNPPVLCGNDLLPVKSGIEEHSTPCNDVVQPVKSGIEQNSSLCCNDVQPVTSEAEQNSPIPCSNDVQPETSSNDEHSITSGIEQNSPVSCSNDEQLEENKTKQKPTPCSNDEQPEANTIKQKPQSCNNDEQLHVTSEIARNPPALCSDDVTRATSEIERSPASRDNPVMGGNEQNLPVSCSNDEQPATKEIDQNPRVACNDAPVEVEKQECGVKCCDESQSNNVDENHNNEFDGDPRSSCMIEPSNFCQDVEAILGAIENSEGRAGNSERPEQKDVDEYDHSALMSELEEMMNERMKHENAAHKDVLDDIYTFVPSPTHEKAQEKSKVKEARPTSKIERVIEAVKAKSACAMMAKNNSDERPKDAPPSQLKTCELESLDLLWRLPEGTTIHHSKLNDDKEPEIASVSPQISPESTTATISLVKPATPIVTTPPTLPSLIPSQPVQEEPLNLGKPRKQSPSLPQLLKKEAPCKVETKPQISLSHLLDADKAPKFAPDASKSTTEPLAQLKEIMSDPDVTVPDPLLVPKERLSALIANPKREIPRLMALTNEVKYPKLDTNLMEVSLAHLQLLLQSSKKEDELKLIQKHADLLQSHLKNDASSLDPATMNALNQMLWFPYISHLDMSRGSNPQDLMGMMNMMYPYNAWGQQSYDYAQQSHLMNFWQDMAQKPGSASVTKGYGDMYKPLVPPSLYTSAPTMGAQMHQTPSYHARPNKRRRSGSGTHATPDFLKTPTDFHKNAPDFLKSPFDVSWALPQTSEAGRLPAPRAPSRSEARPEPAIPSAAAGTPTPSPKLKVRKFDVDPNAVPKLINKNLTPNLPPLTAMARQVPSHYYDSNHLWNPLYGA